MFVEGVLEFRLPGLVVINCGGVGYSVVMNNTAVAGFSVGQRLRLFTHMSVKEDSHSLFGFPTLEELNMFNMLISVSGVGPKAAQSLLGVLSPARLSLAMLSDDVAALSKAPGVGKKTAARIVLELKDKLATTTAALEQSPQARLELQDNDASSPTKDATEALVALGYARSEALRAVLESALKGMTTEDIIKAALRKLI